MTHEEFMNAINGRGVWPSQRYDRMKEPPIEKIEVRDIEQMYPEMIDYAKLDCEATKKLHDIIDREIERRKHMSNITTIGWNVEHIEVEKKNPYSPARIDATIVGFTPGNPIGRDVYEHIMRCLNSNPHRDTRPRTKAQPTIRDVIFNPPATIVFWSDDTKTVVKCQEGDTYDPEKGLAMAIVKKTFGNQGNYCEKLKPWLEKYEDKKRSEVASRFVFADEIEAIRSSYRPVTAHYGYIAVREPVLGKVWKVCHKDKDEIHILCDNPAKKTLHHTYLCRDMAVVICHDLEKANYGE